MAGSCKSSRSTKWKWIERLSTSWKRLWSIELCYPDFCPHHSAHTCVPLTCEVKDTAFRLVNFFNYHEEHVPSSEVKNSIAVAIRKTPPVPRITLADCRVYSSFLCYLQYTNFSNLIAFTRKPEWCVPHTQTTAWGRGEVILNQNYSTKPDFADVTTSFICHSPPNDVSIS